MVGLTDRQSAKKIAIYARLSLACLLSGGLFVLLSMFEADQTGELSRIPSPPARTFVD